MQLRKNIGYRQFAPSPADQLHRLPGLQIDARN
jgi:hypothetical protein